MPIFNKVRAFRLQKKITQEELAQEVSVSRQTIIAIEKGTYEPSLGLALRLAGFFRCDVEDLFSLK